MNFNEIPEFAKEFQRLCKKFRSLNDDLSEFKKVISNIPLGTSKHFHVIANENSKQIVKARFFCKYLKGSSLRIVYSYYKNKNLIEFIEIYFKGEQENENRERIKAYLNLSNK